MKEIGQYTEALLVGGIRIGANLLMIGALFLAMYLASASYGSGMLTFCAWFFGITVPVWVCAIILTKQVRKRAKKNMVSYLVLPGRKEPCLVEWKVLGTKEDSSQNAV